MAFSKGHPSIQHINVSGTNKIIITVKVKQPELDKAGISTPVLLLFFFPPVFFSVVQHINNSITTKSSSLDHVSLHCTSITHTGMLTTSFDYPPFLLPLLLFGVRGKSSSQLYNLHTNRSFLAGRERKRSEVCMKAGERRSEYVI